MNATMPLLHHYASSPFAEKLRAILGYKQLAWTSVMQPQIMPKADLQALTGGYRRIPVLQIGADVYCDTALICDVLEQLQPTPSLFPPGLKGASRTVAQWADSSLFWSTMAYVFQPKAFPEIFAGQPPEALAAFTEDRKAMRAGMPRQAVGDATAALKSYLRRLASMLETQPFLLGQVPSVADFSSYHALWYVRRVSSIAAVLDATPAVLAWMDRIAVFSAASKATMSKATPEEALDLARASTPASVAQDLFQDEHGIALGSRVAITAESFGLEASEGELVAATRTRFTLRRNDPRAGNVHVHFPRIGYVLKTAT
jgi:glutathione S-transferase